MNENNYMDFAIEQAKMAEILDEVPVGAVLINENNGQIISASHNEVLKENNAIKHAEIVVIEKACKIRDSKYLFDTSIYITLEPCFMCAAALSEVRVKKIYFGAYDEKKGAIENGIRIFSNKNYYKPDIYGGIKEKECSILLKDYFFLKGSLNEYKAQYSRI